MMMFYVVHTCVQQKKLVSFAIRISVLRTYDYLQIKCRYEACVYQQRVNPSMPQTSAKCIKYSFQMLKYAFNYAALCLGTGKLYNLSVFSAAHKYKVMSINLLLLRMIVCVHSIEASDSIRRTEGITFWTVSIQLSLITTKKGGIVSHSWSARYSGTSWILSYRYHIENTATYLYELINGCIDKYTF